VIADRRILGGDSEVSKRVLRPRKNPNIFHVTIWKALQIGRRQSSSLFLGLWRKYVCCLTGFQTSVPI